MACAVNVLFALDVSVGVKLVDVVSVEDAETDGDAVDEEEMVGDSV